MALVLVNNDYFNVDSSNSLCILGIPPKELCVTHIVDNIYLGDANSRYYVEELGIDRVVEIGERDELKNYLPLKVQTLPVEISDNREVSIEPFTVKVWDFIQTNDKPVLIHCKMGVSRSATFVLSYMIVKKGYTLHEALEYVRSKRSHQYTQPNRGFMKFLKSIQHNG